MDLEEMGIMSAKVVYFWLDFDRPSTCFRNWEKIRFVEGKKGARMRETVWAAVSLRFSPRRLDIWHTWFHPLLFLITLLINQVMFPTELGYSLRIFLGIGLWAAATNLSGWFIRLIYWVHYLFIYSTFIEHLNRSRHLKVIQEQDMKLTF